MIRYVLPLILMALTAPATAGPFEAALDAYKRGNGEMALTLWRTLADAGDTAALFNVGVLYEHGRGVPQDLAEAARWYGRAADLGDVYAQTKLGALYAEGKGVDRDLEQAAQWYERAAERDHPTAQYALGTLYANGRGVPKDLGMAAKWYGRADSNTCTTSAVTTADGLRNRSALGQPQG